MPLKNLLPKMKVYRSNEILQMLTEKGIYFNFMSQQERQISVHLFCLLMSACLELPWRNCSNTGAIIMGTAQGKMWPAGTSAGSAVFHFKNGFWGQIQGQTMLLTVSWNSWWLSSCQTCFLAKFIITEFIFIYLFLSLLKQPVRVCLFTDLMLYRSFV